MVTIVSKVRPLDPSAITGLIATTILVLSLSGLILVGNWEWHREAERACAWAERGDVFDECAQAFDQAGSSGARNVAHRYGDPTND